LIAPYIIGQFVTHHGTQVVDLVNPTENKVSARSPGRDIDTEKNRCCERGSSAPFRKAARNLPVELLQRLPTDAVAQANGSIVKRRSWNPRTADRAKGIQQHRGEHFLHFKKVSKISPGQTVRHI